MLRVCGFHHSVRVLGWLSGSTSLSNAPAEGDLRPLAETIASTVQAVARRHPLPSSCLSRSLVLWSLLRRWGIDSRLRIGVNKQEGSFEAHAWVEHRGEALGNDKRSCEQHVALDRAITWGT